MEKEKVNMIATAWKVVDYMNDKPNADTEEIIRYVLKEIRHFDREEKIKAVSAANRAIKYKSSLNLKLGDKEIIQRIMNELNEILEEIEKSEEEE